MRKFGGVVATPLLVRRVTKNTLVRRGLILPLLIIITTAGTIIIISIAISLLLFQIIKKSCYAHYSWQINRHEKQAGAWSSDSCDVVINNKIFFPLQHILKQLPGILNST